MKKPKVYESESWLRKKFYDERKSIDDIAKIAGVSSNTIRTRLKKFNIK